MYLSLDSIKKICLDNERIYIYGAGKNSTLLYRFLKLENIKVDGFFVSEMKGNPLQINQCPVLEVDEYHRMEKGVILVAFFPGSQVYKQVFNKLIELNINNIIFINQKILKEIENRIIELIVSKENYHIGTNQYTEMEHNILAMKGIDNWEFRWRFSNNTLLKQENNIILDIFKDKTALEEFELLYGKYYPVKELNKITTQESVTYNIYMAKSHVDRYDLKIELPKEVIPIQAGAALTDKRISNITDNTGDNISERNRNYSECTVLYWMWKNAPETNYIGLYHYRRHLDICEEDVRKLKCENVDVLVSLPNFAYEGAAKFFAECIPYADIDLLSKVIGELYPDYQDAVKEYWDARFFPTCNLMLMKYDLFINYAEFVFSITFKIEEYYESIKYCREDRYIGYLIETLLGIYLIKNKEKLKIAYSDMKYYR